MIFLFLVIFPFISFKKIILYPIIINTGEYMGGILGGTWRGFLWSLNRNKKRRTQVAYVLRYKWRVGCFSFLYGIDIVIFKNDLWLKLYKEKN